ncbi:MAG: transporter substrate-binding domain-containing protein [Eubacteriales bacterium]|nr:transporter substrate-binding domain-containing protein [Eubacteriales bacterium]
MRHAKKIIALALVSVLSLSLLAGCAKKESNEFKVGLECNYAPFNWTQTDTSNGAVSISNSSSEYAGGYDVEVAKKIAAKLGKELVIVKTEWDGLIPALTSGKIDAIIAGMSPTEERKATVDFSDSYYRSDLVVVVKKDSPFASAQSLSDLNGAKITAQLNTFHYEVVEQIAGVDKQTAMDNFPAMIVAVASGKIDGYVSEKPGAISAVAANTDLTYLEFSAGQGFTYADENVAVAVAVKKGSTDLIQSINEALAEIPQDQRDTLMETAIKTQPVTQ